MWSFVEKKKKECEKNLQHRKSLQIMYVVKVEHPDYIKYSYNHKNDKQPNLEMGKGLE